MPSFPVAHSVQIDEKTVPASPLFAMFDARAHHEEQPFARHDRGRHVGCGGRPRERRQIGTGLARKRPARSKKCGIACRSGTKGREQTRITEPLVHKPTITVAAAVILVGDMVGWAQGSTAAENSQTRG